MRRGPTVRQLLLRLVALLLRWPTEADGTSGVVQGFEPFRPSAFLILRAVAGGIGVKEATVIALKVMEAPQTRGMATGTRA